MDKKRIQAAVGVAPADGLISPAYVVAQPFPGTVPGYFAYLYRTAAYMGEVNNYSRGIVADRNRLYWDEFKQIPTPYPPPPEQVAIVRFLDQAERRVRRYIRAKRKLIGLLNEMKQGIIHRTVTRGLDPNVRLKPSGVEWLGDVPEHWRSTRLKHLATIQTGITLGSLGKNYGSEVLVERPYLRVANVQTGRLDLSQVKTLRMPPTEAESALLREGDVLMTEGGDIDKLGRGCIWTGEIPGCLHQNHIFAVRPRRHWLLPEFLVGLMGSLYGRGYFEITAKKTTNLASTNATTIGSLPLWLPEIEEQRRILAWVAEKTSALDVMRVKVEREIDLIHEFRTRLISDLVTGKVDVREAAAKLPEEPDESETYDKAQAQDESKGESVEELEVTPKEAEV